MTYNPIFEYLPIEKIIKDNQEEYYRVLAQSHSTGSSTVFIEFMRPTFLIAPASELFADGLDLWIDIFLLSAGAKALELFDEDFAILWAEFEFCSDDDA